MRKIKRAIILAAGQGIRLRPYTDKTPKPLLPVKGKPIIEYTIESLLQKNIKDITIVIGYKAEQFKYLKEKYNVDLRINADYDKASNVLSLLYAIDKLDNCIILDGDVIIKPAAIRSSVMHSGYSYVKEKCACEWSMTFDEDKRIRFILADLTEKHDFNALHSISYWVGEQAHEYRRLLHSYGLKLIAMKTDELKYVDDLAITISELYAFEMKHKDFLEIDTVEDYENANKN